MRAGSDRWRQGSKLLVDAKHGRGSDSGHDQKLKCKNFMLREGLWAIAGNRLDRQHGTANKHLKSLAIPAGFEPATLCLEGRCSIQLSYGTEVTSGAVRRRQHDKGLTCEASRVFSLAL